MIPLPWSLRTQQIRLLAEVSAQSRVPLTPVLETRSHGREQMYLLWGSLQIGSTAEETDAQLRVPADVVPSAQLVLEESGQQQALGACRFQHAAIVPQTRVEDEMVKHLGERGGRRQIDRGTRGYPSVVREHTRVVEQFVTINGGFRHLLQTPDKKLKRLLFPRCEQFWR